MNLESFFVSPGNFEIDEKKVYQKIKHGRV
jgi:hypothetical protein